jgi:autotransporter family porin
VRRVLPVLLLVLSLVLPASAGADALIHGGPNAKPRSDRAAAKLVRRSAFEPRSDNQAANHRKPTTAQLRDFRRRSDMPNKARVTGNFAGTTDEILQWAAHKWRVAPDLLRAVATVESWWHMSTLGDGGDSFGLMQVRRPYHCCEPLTRYMTAFNVDYYGGILRAYYGGKQPWLNQVERGQLYRPGDTWGSVGVWASGRWHLNDQEYVAKVKQRLAEKTWRTDRWF